MFEDYMNHTCNIFHLKGEKIKIGYGIKATDTKSADVESSESGVKCHFHLKMNNYLRVSQKEPHAVVEGDVKISFPPGTDIRQNDIVEDCRNGIKFRAGIPKEVHGGHHIIVTVSPLEGVSEAL